MTRTIAGSQTARERSRYQSAIAPVTAATETELHEAEVAYAQAAVTPRAGRPAPHLALVWRDLVATDAAIAAANAIDAGGTDLIHEIEEGI